MAGRSHRIAEVGLNPLPHRQQVQAVRSFPIDTDRSTLWDNPLTFDSDRFSPEKSEGRGRWQYIPFGGGTRSCIGDHFAMLDATLALATFIRRAEVHSLEDDFPHAVHFTMVAGGPILAGVRGRRVGVQAASG